MTISCQVKQTLASLKSAQASFESFALATQNQQAKQLYTCLLYTSQGSTFFRTLI